MPNNQKILWWWWWWWWSGLKNLSETILYQSHQDNYIDHSCAIIKSNHAVNNVTVSASGRHFLTSSAGSLIPTGTVEKYIGSMFSISKRYPM
jgi:hypothetical protein